jgi:hypothetical protein
VEYVRPGNHQPFPASLQLRMRASFLAKETLLSTRVPESIWAAAAFRASLVETEKTRTEKIEFSASKM